MLQSIKDGVPRKPDVDRIVGAFRRKLQREGDVVTHSEMMLESGLPPMRYNQLKTRAKREFLNDTGVSLCAVHGEGFRYPTGIEQVEEGSVTDTKRAARQLMRGVKKTAAVSNARLDAPGIAVRDHSVGRVRYMAEMMRAERKALVAVVGKPEVRPQLPSLS